MPKITPKTVCEKVSEVVRKEGWDAAEKACEKMMQSWQPIETVPKDGTEVILYNKEWMSVVSAYWKREHWITFFAWSDGVFPTHWMPFVPPEDED